MSVQIMNRPFSEDQGMRGKGANAMNLAAVRDHFDRCTVTCGSPLNRGLEQFGTNGKYGQDNEQEDFHDMIS